MCRALVTVVLGAYVLAMCAACSSVQVDAARAGALSCVEQVQEGEPRGWCLVGTTVGAVVVGGVVASSAAADL